MKTSHKLTTLVLTAALLLGGALGGQAHAGLRLFTVLTGTGRVYEIDPATGVEIRSFGTPGVGNHPGLAFNNREVFYTDETLPVVKVYTPQGTFVRDMAKPGGLTDGGGLGVSSTSLYGVGSETISAVDVQTGAPQTSFFLSLARDALTFAGSRGTLFVRVGDAGEIDELALDGTAVNAITGPTSFGGLAFSSSTGILFGSVDGFLYAMDPDTGAQLRAPIQVKDALGNPFPASGGLAADEIEEGRCGDGIVNGNEECDDGNTRPFDACDNSCRLTSHVTRPTSFWKNQPTVIDGSFDGPAKLPSLLGFSVCGKTIATPCDAIKLMNASGFGVTLFKREAVTTMLNCRAFNSCPPIVTRLLKSANNACAHQVQFPYGLLGAALDFFNRSGERLSLPFIAPAPTTNACR